LISSIQDCQILGFLQFDWWKQQPLNLGHSVKCALQTFINLDTKQGFARAQILAQNFTAVLHFGPTQFTDPKLVAEILPTAKSFQGIVSHCRGGSPKWHNEPSKIDSCNTSPWNIRKRYIRASEHESKRATQTKSP